MSGSLEEIPLPDLLQLFGSSRKSGVLVVKSDGKVGRIFLKEGLIRCVIIDGRECGYADLSESPVMRRVQGVLPKAAEKAVTSFLNVALYFFTHSTADPEAEVESQPIQV